jgi:large conductance mechanosensitive channel
MLTDFKAFLIKQNILALAIAVVVGTALGGLVKAVVDGFVMPIVGVITPSGDWQKATWTIGPVHFGTGLVLAALLNFLIVGFVAWRISRAFIRETPTPATKVCQHCRMTIDAAATRCPHCTSQLATSSA